jgi:hypothetical protein
VATVTGFDPATSGQQPEDVNGNPVPVGVWGDSSTGGGVFGTSGALPPGSGIPIDPPAGVEGHGADGPGVVGRSVTDNGVVGESQGAPGMLARSSGSSGLLGVTFSPDDGSHGVFGSSTAGGNGVTGFVGSATGAVGNSVRGTGVRGTSGSGTGVFGQTFGDGLGGGAGPAVLGTSDVAVGVRGVTGSTNATEALTFGEGHGLSALHFSAKSGGGVLGVSVLGSGVEGFTFSSLRDNADVAAVRGQSANGLAGLFVGRVRVTGALTKGGGGFTVDHPNDPENRYLSHSFVESPDMLNVYSGTVTTDEDGAAQVELPSYFEALNRDFRYQLTVIGDFARAMVSEEVKGNEFAIRTDVPRVKVCWQVTGVRRDAWAEANRIEAEEAKPSSERGQYLHPELFDKSAGIHHIPTTRLAQVLPEELRDGAERTLSDLATAGAAGSTDLAGRLDEAARWQQERAAAARARFEEDWRTVQDTLEGIRPATGGEPTGR